MYVGLEKPACKPPGLSTADRWQGAGPKKKGESKELEAGERWRAPPTGLISVS